MTDIVFTAKFVASKVGLDGITVTWNIDRVTRSTGAVTALVTGDATNVIYGRNGRYGYRLAGADLTLYDYLATAITTDVTVDQRELDAVWTYWSADGLEQADILLDATPFAGANIDAAISAIKAKTDRIGTGTATLVAPVTRSGQVRIIQGDAYYNTDGRALDWSDDTWNIAETSTVVVILHGVITFVAERLSATQIRLELSSTQTLALPVGNAIFSIQEITTGGNTLSRVSYGTWNTAAQPTPVYTP